MALWNCFVMTFLVEWVCPGGSCRASLKRPARCRGPLIVYISFHFLLSFVFRDSKEIFKKSFCVQFTPWRIQGAWVCASGPDAGCQVSQPGCRAQGTCSACLCSPSDVGCCVKRQALSSLLSGGRLGSRGPASTPSVMSPDVCTATSTFDTLLSLFY